MADERAWRQKMLSMLQQDGFHPGRAPLCEGLLGRVDQVVERWGVRYRNVLPEGYFDAASFAAWNTDELGTFLALVDRMNPAQLIDAFFERGRRLEKMNVPFDELVLSIHLMEMACADVLRDAGLSSAAVANARDTLDILNHVRIATMARAYFLEAQDAARDVRAHVIEEIARVQQQAGRERFCGMIGKSLIMQQTFEQLSLVAQGRHAVLLIGESGTGKEMAARAIHTLSGDETDRFVPVNCAALPHELIEGELFGHKKGAFSGASEDKLGLFQAANRGTLFLDEITELPPMAQAKLLRPLQEHAVRPVGGTKEIPISTRVIASTNLTLDELRNCGRLRRDLFYRLQGFIVQLPPLRVRAEDVPLLAGHFLERANRSARLPKKGVAQGAIDRLSVYPWPGNVRELMTVIERAVITGPDIFIREEDLSPEIRGEPTRAEHTDPLSLKHAERITIVRALEKAGGNKSAAARILGISRKQLYVKLERYGIERSGI